MNVGNIVLFDCPNLQTFITNKDKKWDILN